MGASQKYPVNACVVKDDLCGDMLVSSRRNLVPRPPQPKIASHTPATAFLQVKLINVVNYSLQQGSFPCCFKTAHITPVLKKAGLDRNTLKNYGPVSNLSYISQLIEKTVAKQTRIQKNCTVSPALVKD